MASETLGIPHWIMSRHTASQQSPKTESNLGPWK